MVEVVSTSNEFKKFWTQNVPSPGSKFLVDSRSETSKFTLDRD